MSGTSEIGLERNGERGETSEGAAWLTYIYGGEGYRIVFGVGNSL